MATSVLSAGLAIQLVPSVIYALPAGFIQVTWSSGVSATIEVSTDGTNWATLGSPGTNGSVSTGANYLRCAQSNVTVTTDKLQKSSSGSSGSTTDGSFTNSLAVGGSPAQSGDIRLKNGSSIMFRNQANTGDLILAQDDAGNSVYLGQMSAAGGDTYIRAFSLIHFSPEASEVYRMSQTAFYPNIDGVGDIGKAGTARWRNIFVSGAVANRTKAGVPADTDVNTPTDGMMIIDTTNNKIMVRVGGVWKGVAVT